MNGSGSSNDAYHGKDGLGDVTIADVDPVDLGVVKPEPAAYALCQLVNRYKGFFDLQI